MTAVSVGFGRRGRWLPPALFAAVTLIVVAASGEALIGRTAAIAFPCDPRDCVLPLLTAEGMTNLSAHGLTLAGYAALSTIIAGVGVLAPLGLGLLVALRGDGARRWLLGAVLVALAFGQLSAFSSWPWAQHALPPLAAAGLFWMIAVFPTMTLVPRWAWIPAAAASIWAGLMQAVPPIADAITHRHSPWTQLVGPGFLLCITALLVAHLLRFRRSGPETRRAQGQLMVGLGVMLVTGIVGAMLVLGSDTANADAPVAGTAGVAHVWAQGTVAGNLFLQVAALLWLGVGVVIASACLRDRVYGMRTVVDNVLTGTVLIVLAGAGYALTVFVLGLAIGSGPAAAVAATATAALIALGFPPLRRGIDRLVYGNDDGGAIISALTARVAATTAAEAALPGVLEELCTRMRWPWAEFAAAAPDGTDSPAVRSGSGSGRTGTVDLGIGVGTITVGLRPGQRRLTRRDRRALRGTAGAFAAARSIVRLTELAETARHETVIARADERAMLRRRLHDGVAPGLTVARHIVQGVRQDLPDAAAARPALATADVVLSDALAQVRMLSRELRPPLLDELGFGAAVHAFAHDLGIDAVLAPDPELPDDTLIGLYRIAVEALVNAQRHGSATAATIAVSTDDGVRMQITDNGLGLADTSAAGVGLASMRERAAELGGSLRLGPAPHGGAMVVVHIPRPDTGEPERTGADPAEVAR